MRPRPGWMAILLMLISAACSPAAVSSPTGRQSTAVSSRPPTIRPSAPPSPSPTPSPSSPFADHQDLLLVTAFADEHLVLIDPEDGEVGRIVVGRAPWGVAVAPDGRAYVATLDGVAVVDVAGQVRTDLIPYSATLAVGPTEGEYRPGGLGIAVSPDGSRVYVGVTTEFPSPGVLEVIDTAAVAIVGSVPVGIRQFDVVVSADGAEVFAINHDSFDVTAVDAASLAVTRTLPAAPLGDELGLASWNKPHYAALTESGTLLMAYKGVLLLELDPRSGSTSSRPLASQTHSQGVELTPDGLRLLVVGDGPDDTSRAGPSLEVVELGDGSSMVVALDGSHNDVAVSADGSTAFVTGGSSREGYPRPDVVTVVDLQAGRVTASHPVPGNPLVIVRWPPR